MIEVDGVEHKPAAYRVKVADSVLVFTEYAGAEWIAHRSGLSVTPLYDPVAIEALWNEVLKYRAKHQAMHRRAQTAESTLRKALKLINELNDRLVFWGSRRRRVL